MLFYGSGAFESGRGPVLGHHAVGDEFEPDEGVDALQRRNADSGRTVELIRYPGVKHWFFEPDRPTFDPDAAAAAWERTTAFLREHLAP